MPKLKKNLGHWLQNSVKNCRTRRLCQHHRSCTVDRRYCHLDVCVWQSAITHVCRSQHDGSVSRRAVRGKACSVRAPEHVLVLRADNKIVPALSKQKASTKTRSVSGPKLRSVDTAQLEHEHVETDAPKNHP